MSFSQPSRLRDPWTQRKEYLHSKENDWEPSDDQHQQIMTSFCKAVNNLDIIWNPGCGTRQRLKAMIFAEYVSIV